MVEIPPDTKWHEVKTLTEDDLHELYVSARHNQVWDGAGNKLDCVAKVDPAALKSPPERWARIILWGHDQSGPFTILEGCHRMLAYATATPRPPISIPVYVGLSASFCFWHAHDPPLSVGQGLYREELGIVPRGNDWLDVN